jgi:hypothetical protein
MSHSGDKITNKEEKTMKRLEIEEQTDLETGEEVGHSNLWVYEDKKLLTEVHWLTDEDSDKSMRELGFIPLEEKWPGEEITGYQEFGETLYVQAAPAERVAAR